MRSEKYPAWTKEAVYKIVVLCNTMADNGEVPNNFDIGEAMRDAWEERR